MLDSLMAHGRAAAERLMADECRVTKAGGVTIDPDTGQSVPQVTEVYAGKCKVQTSGGVGGDTTDTGVVVNEWLVRVDFPWATQGLTVQGADLRRCRRRHDRHGSRRQRVAGAR